MVTLTVSLANIGQTVKEISLQESFIIKMTVSLTNLTNFKGLIKYRTKIRRKTEILSKKTLRRRLKSVLCSGPLRDTLIIGFTSLLSESDRVSTLTRPLSHLV